MEEIDAEYRELFLNAGGEKFHYIASVNDNPDFIEALSDVVLENAQGWLTLKNDRDVRLVSSS